jgi:hypothetical protein
MKFRKKAIKFKMILLIIMLACGLVKTDVGQGLLKINLMKANGCGDIPVGCYTNPIFKTDLICPNPFEPRQYAQRSAVTVYHVNEAFLLDSSNWIKYSRYELPKQLRRYLLKRTLCGTSDAGDFCHPNAQLHYLLVPGFGDHDEIKAGYWANPIIDVMVPEQSQHEVLFNPSAGNTLASVLARACYVNPSPDSPFIRRVIERTLQLLREDKNVVLIGHSYGGMVLGVVANYLSRIQVSRDVLAKRVRIVTTGSIYVPTLDRVQGVPLLHIMYRGDIAMKCNHLREPALKTEFDFIMMDKTRNVLWLDNQYYSGKLDFFQRWELHREYKSVLEDCLAILQSREKKD